MSDQRLDRLNPSTIYEEHKRQFALISPWLEVYYRGYINRDKITSLLSYWLYAYRCILTCYGIECAKHFCRSDFGSHLRFAYFYEYGSQVNLKLKKTKCTFLFRVAAELIGNSYLPGGRIRSVYSKCLWRITKLLAISAPITVQAPRKAELLSKLVDCFEGYNASVIMKCFKDALPPVFFADQINLFVNKALRVDCSASTFMDFCGYENLFLLGRRLQVVGRQHGGGYDMFTDDLLSFFEKELCDRFIGWGMSCSNERQHRYPIGDLPSTSDTGGKRLIWVEHCRVPSIMFLMSPTMYLQTSRRTAIHYLYNELVAAGREYSSLAYPFQLKSSDYVGMRGNELSSQSGRGEEVFCANDVVIFDVAGASLIHYCIEHEIIFLLVLCREDLLHFTETAKEWLNVLRRSGLVFFEDEIHLLSRRLDEIMSDKFDLPANVKRYHKNMFVDIFRSGTH